MDPYRTATQVAASPVVEDPNAEKTTIVDVGRISVTYSPYHSVGVSVVADVKDGIVGEPMLQAAIAPELTREGWERLKAIGDRAWAEFDKAMRARNSR